MHSTGMHDIKGADDAPFFMEIWALTVKKYLAPLLLLLLSGCASTGDTQWRFPPMAIPLQPTLQQEIQLARVEQLLTRDDLDDKTRAQLYYERGLIHDSLGLRDLARLDFNQSLSLKPDQPDVFNILGVYFTQSGQFDAAYEAFDSTLELDGTHTFAERNRGIALYYGGRFPLAYDDLIKHYQEDINDPYRAIWLYLVELELKDPITAKHNLSTRLAASNKQDWGWQIARLYAGAITERDFFYQIAATSKDNAELAQRLTEGYFYIGKQYQFQGDVDTAIALYKLAMAGNVYEFVEHRYAWLELSRIAYNSQQRALPVNGS